MPNLLSFSYKNNLYCYLETKLAASWLNSLTLKRARMRVSLAQKVTAIFSYYTVYHEVSSTMKFGYTAWVGNVRSLVSYFLKKTSLVIQIISMLAYTSVRISETNIRLDNRNAQCYNGSIVKINTIMCYRYSGTSNWLCENKERAFKNI